MDLPISIDMPDDFPTSSAKSSMITSDWSPDEACIFSGISGNAYGKKIEKKSCNFIKLNEAEMYKKRDKLRKCSISQQLKETSYILAVQI